MLIRIASLAFVFAILSSSAAHMILENPVPYGQSTLNNSPLDDSGLDFPCKLRAGVYDLTRTNYWTAGEAQTVSFLGSAVHGGGSCQFSVTNDLQPTKASQWKVVHSVVGGCPASHGAATFDVTLPKGLPSGRYTFAWTWFNREGDREMYMNCAPISVGGGGNDTTFLEKLPDMFVANLPRRACSTVEGFDYAFPDPGDSVTTDMQAKIATTLDGPACASVTALGVGSETMRPAEGPSRSLQHHSGEAATLNQILRASADPTQSASTTNVEDVVLMGTSTVEPQMHVAQLAPTSAHKAGALASTTPVAPVASSPTCMPCGSEDDILCIDEHRFGICNQGCALPQPLAAGTVCLDGRILRDVLDDCHHNIDHWSVLDQRKFI
ncbi:hypothetical protein PMIN01_13346 [Paraphaeosphaeria minitans]|uniref:Lytic polysaccharide monooxygenase n=1 Tax=Paraphaeosphaeria minitans TaxID=565426 RepID=A0A9P6G4U2_9PLEO|nr:hypothetical protein PMIN01_13346 [Paraphaeosphaeria minitans]